MIKKVIALSLGIILCFPIYSVSGKSLDLSYTKIISPSYIGSDYLTEVTINDSDISFPNTVLTDGNATPAKDLSNISNVTGAKVKNYAQFRFKGISSGVGVLFYIELSDNCDEVTPQIYLIKNYCEAQYQYENANWYTLQQDDSCWKTEKISNYGPKLYKGFKGYLYIPYDSINLTGSSIYKPIVTTDLISGFSLWINGNNTGDGITIGMPSIVMPDYLVNNLPTCDYVLKDSIKTKMFAEEEYDIPLYDGKPINYCSVDIMKAYSVNLTKKMKVSDKIFDESYTDFNNQQDTCLIKSICPVTTKPSFSITKKTKSVNEILCSMYPDISRSSNGEAIMFYLKVPGDFKSFSFKVLFNFINSNGDYIPAYIYNGQAYVLCDGDEKWSPVTIKDYIMELPEGFCGYIRLNYHDMISPYEPITSSHKLSGINYYIDNPDGRAISISTPIIVEHIGDSCFGAYMNGEQNAARNILNCKILQSDQIGHKFTKKRYIISPTCFDGGKVEYTCSECGTTVIRDTAPSGDVNSDKTVDITDIIRLKKNIASNIIPQDNIGDLNLDGCIRADDLAIMKKELLNYSANTTHIKKMFKSANGTDQALFSNPDRGFRTETVWYLKKITESKNPRSDLEQKLDGYFISCLPETVRMDMVYIYLTDYRNMDIPQDAINTLQLFFSICRERKIKIMLRFAYCDDFTNLSTGADENTILNHIKQLSPIIKDNTDVIHTLQSGFVGAYGEWEPLYQEPSVSYRNVISSIMQNLVIPNNLYYQIRLPRYKNIVLDNSDMYNKIGIDSCAFFGEQNRIGWESGSFQLGNPNGEWEQLTREAALTPQDGELFVNVNLVDTNRMVVGKEAILEMAHHRFATFSCWHGYKEIWSGYENTTVMYGWKQQDLTESWLRENKIIYSPEWFKDEKGNTVERNTFDFIRDHLGYRIEAKSVEAIGKKGTNGNIDINFSLQNYGFSAAFNLKSGFAILDQNGNLIQETDVGDPSKWYSHNPDNYKDDYVPTYYLSSQLALPSEPGKYKIAFYLKNSLGDYAKLNNNIEFLNGYNILMDMNY